MNKKIQDSDESVFTVWVTNPGMTGIMREYGLSYSNARANVLKILTRYGFNTIFRTSHGIDGSQKMESTKEQVRAWLKKREGLG